MIATNIVMTPTVDNNHVSINSWISSIHSDHPVIFDFFQNCIDQNLILNKINMDVDGVSDTTTYYSSNIKNARLFQEQFENQQLNFSIKPMSMKQFWNQFQFDIDIFQQSIDFNTVSGSFELVNLDTREIWSTKFPLTNPFDEHGNLQ
jgi:hypothetical protein